MNISGTDRKPWARLAGAKGLPSVTLVAWVTLLALVMAGHATGTEPGDASGDLSFEASGTLGADLYVIESPFDNDNVTGFFEQYRYIRDKGAELPFFADFTHLNLGLVRPDTTYLIRAERWSRNAINENTLLDINWKGLVVNAEIRRYRSDALRFFPMGTEDDWAGMPLGLGFGTTYNPDVPGLISNFTTNIDALFASDYRIGVERFDVGRRDCASPRRLRLQERRTQRGALACGLRKPDGLPTGQFSTRPRRGGGAHLPVPGEPSCHRPERDQRGHGGGPGPGQDGHCES